MDNQYLFEQFLTLSAALIADSCLRLNQAFRIAPPGIRSLIPGSNLAGQVVPVRHYGSVDVYLEAMSEGKPGDVLVIDNGGRSDEGCIGDLTAMEAIDAGLAGMVLWGFHRDTAELLRLGFPIFSYGVCPAGPIRVDEREPEAHRSARFGDFVVTGQDVVFADDDGVLFVSVENIGEIIATALNIRGTERKQADLLQSGENLREQLRFDDYLRKRALEPSYTFREHLKKIGGAIEE
jgi:regulator of RNase E activity RraA